MKVIGIQHKAGEFKSKDGDMVNYDNYILYCQDPKQNPNWEGIVIEEIKIKKRNLDVILETKKIPDLKHLLGYEFSEASYNKYSDVVDLR